MAESQLVQALTDAGRWRRSVSLILVSPDKLIYRLCEARRPHDELVTVFALEAMELSRPPRAATCRQRRPVQLITQLIRNHSIIFGVQYHDGRPELRYVLIRLKAKAILVDWLQNRRLEPRQIAKQLSV